MPSGDAAPRSGALTAGLDHVLWIGGATGAGKTTVARRLAQRWGLRIYSSDNFTWAHRDRAIAAGVEPAIRYEALSADERAAASAEDRQAMWLGGERASMVIDDLRGLPSSPLVVAEGGVIAPELVDPGRAVWLEPTKDFQLRHRIAEWISIGHSVEIARQRGVPIVCVDGTRTASEIVEEIERALAAPLRSGPCAGSIEERRALLREANLAAIKQVRDGCARPWATADPETQLRSFVCECADPACGADVGVAVAIAAAGPVIAPGHR